MVDHRNTSINTGSAPYHISLYWINVLTTDVALSTTRIHTKFRGVRRVWITLNIYVVGIYTFSFVCMCYYIIILLLYINASVEFYFDQQVVFPPAFLHVCTIPWVWLKISTCVSTQISWTHPLASHICL